MLKQVPYIAPKLRIHDKERTDPWLSWTLSRLTTRGLHTHGTFSIEDIEDALVLTPLVLGV